jgi:hypothetical protein
MSVSLSDSELISYAEKKTAGRRMRRTRIAVSDFRAFQYRAILNKSV